LQCDQECCPCRPDGKGMEGKVEINVNVQGGPPGKTDNGTSTETEKPPRAKPMTPEQFAALIAALGEQGFADDKLTVLSEASKRAHFTVAQTRELLSQFSFPDDKLAALQFLKKRISDVDNLYQLYGAFVHSSDKAEAKRILEGN